jgi:hypothetical protein
MSVLAMVVLLVYTLSIYYFLFLNENEKGGARVAPPALGKWEMLLPSL